MAQPPERRFSTSALVLLLLLPLVAWGQQPDSLTPPILVSYGSKGFNLQSGDGRNLLQIEFRGQFRAAYPTDSDPISLDDFDQDRVYLKVNRARMKVGGHAYRPEFKYYLEYELFATNLLDFRVMYEPLAWLNFKVGQWKVQYNRERIISSGKQQTMDRSILTRPFTVDRQQGVSVYGRLRGRGLWDFNYWVSVFMGTGRGNTLSDDGNLMYMTRWQWNLTGTPLEFSGSDLEGTSPFQAIVAVAAVTNQSPYTRFSQAGGGQLTGYPTDESGQYRVNQWMQESAGMYRGFSWQQEFHWKEIKDLAQGGVRTLMGNLLQCGYFFHQVASWFPARLETFGRYAVYNPFRGAGYLDSEISGGFNYFIHGHRNKLTLEFSYFNVEFADESLRKGGRIRLQWDVSF